MTGRGRGRPPGPRQPPQQPPVAAGRGRRSTRHQDQQQQQQVDPDQETRDFQIDPDIASSQSSEMPPPPIPSNRGRSVQSKEPELPHVERPPVAVARKFAPRDTRAQSMASVNSMPVSAADTEMHSSQTHAELQNRAARTPEGTTFTTPARSQTYTPSQTTAGRLSLMEKFLTYLPNSTHDLYGHLRNFMSSENSDEWLESREALKDAFNSHRRIFARGSAPVVSIQNILDGLGLAKDSPQGMAAAGTIAAANLTNLLDEITYSLHFGTDEADPLTLLQAWEEQFPDDFLLTFNNLDKDMADGITIQTIEIRQQLFIHTLESLQRNNSDTSPPINPWEKLMEIFLEPGSTVEQLEDFMQQTDADDYTLALPCKAIGHVNIAANQWLAKSIQARIRNFCSSLPNEAIDGRALNLVSLREAYPWETFLTSLADDIPRWYKAATEGLVQPISAFGSDAASGADTQIQSQLENEALAHNSARGESRPASDMDAVFSALATGQVGPDGHDAHGRLASQDILQRSREIAYLHPRGEVPYPDFRAYADPPQEQGGFQSNGSMYAESAALVAGKKRRAPGEMAHQASGGAAEGGPSPAKKQRGRRKKAAGPESSGATLVAESSQYPPPPGSQYPPPPTPQVEPDFDAVSQRSREISAAHRKVREPQTRSAWVRSDVRLLVKAVDTFKCKWSVIEKEIKAGTIPFDRPRDQQALRDKARLLKQDFLKADGILPPSFDLVVLGKKERAAVIACGKNPDRRESDVINGQVVNTEYNRGATAPVHAQQPMPEAEMELEPATEQEQEQESMQQGSSNLEHALEPEVPVVQTAA
ncbi:hypothetical protein B0H63DRAFT_457502 [Podospora didyma]|uniref:Myb-like domain-containing protein n=1 Tax=Podospora didyma TaxID=330526 RepID=A0AAE0P4F0_9PEZI|nr:hypothetical protein B0H63DRAFT_457502 [Podospora didyma]